MIACHVKFNESPAVVAPLPPLLPCSFKDLLSRNVFRAVTIMGVIFADGASACATCSACCLLASDVERGDKQRAGRLGAIGPIRSLEFNALQFECGE